MALLESLLVPLLIALAVFALLLGVLARLILWRILRDHAKAANDPVYTRRHRVQCARVRERPPLRLVA